MGGEGVTAETLKTIAEVINGGGNLALILCAWWIHRAETQLTLIREALDIKLKKE